MKNAWVVVLFVPSCTLETKALGPQEAGATDALQTSGGTLTGDLVLDAKGTASASSDFGSHSVVFRGSVWTGSQPADSDYVLHHDGQSLALGGGGTDKLFFDPSGAIGIGAPPGDQLYVFGNGPNVAIHLQNGGPNNSDWGIDAIPNDSLIVLNKRGTAATLTLAPGPTVQPGATGLVQIYSSLLVSGAASKPGGGSWTDSSDARLKHDIEPLTGALEHMLRLRGVTYRWNEPTKHGDLRGRQIGFIAQDVERVFPDWIAFDRDGYRTLTIRGFEAMTVEAVRILKLTMDELRADNEKLKQRNDALESTLAKLETRLVRLENGRGQGGPR